MAKLPIEKGERHQEGSGKDGDSLSAQQREFWEDADKAELQRWQKDGDRPKTGDSIRDGLRNRMDRARRARALGVRPGIDIGEIAKRGKVKQGEERYQGVSLYRLRFKARREAERLLVALSGLHDAEEKSPEKKHHREEMVFLAALERLGGLRPAAARNNPLPEPLRRTELERQQKERTRFLDSLSTPECMRALLPRLIEILDQRAKSRRGRGRPSDLQLRRVQEAAKEAGLSDGKVALLLRSEGLAPPQENYKRVRDRRRRPPRSGKK